MSVRNLSQIVNLLLAVAAFGVSLLLFGEISGFRQGMMAAYGPNESHQISTIATHGPNFFDFVKARYLLLSISYFAYVIGRVLDVEHFPAFLRYLSLGVSLFVYGQLLLFKYGIDDSAVLLYRPWLNTSVRLDWLCFSVAIVLLISDLTASLASFWANRKATA